LWIGVSRPLGGTLYGDFQPVATAASLPPAHNSTGSAV
jgi:hypothetical protein